MNACGKMQHFNFSARNGVLIPLVKKSGKLNQQKCGWSKGVPKRAYSLQFTTRPKFLLLFWVFKKCLPITLSKSLRFVYSEMKITSLECFETLSLGCLRDAGKKKKKIMLRLKE